MANPKTYYAGLDVGGSTIKSVLIDEKGLQCGEMIEVPSKVKEGYEQSFIQLEDSLNQLAAEIGISRSRIKGLGLDVPAPSSNGIVWGQANMSKDWVGTRIRDIFSKRVGKPVYMTNDVNAAALGEYALRKTDSSGLLFVAPGTGFGGGLILPGGKLYEGANGLALEVGHLTVPFREEDGEMPKCSCGIRGCLETWVSLTALTRRIELELAKEQWQGHPLKVSSLSAQQKAFQLRDYAEKEDPLALYIFKQQAHILGYALGDLVRLFDPGLVVIGGGLAESAFREKYIKWVRDGFADHSWPMYQTSPVDPAKTTTKISWAMGGDYSAALGMAFIAREMFNV